MAKTKTSPNNYESSQNFKFNVAEAYKTIRTNIIFSLSKKECKTIVISSSKAAEGKSTITANIALSMAQTDAKVLLIDADLRSPKLYKLLGMSNTPGMTNYLCGLNSSSEIIRDTKHPNLKVITAGSLAPNPAELLAGKVFSDLLETLKTQFDYIFIDTPPINILSDALPIIKTSDGVVLVVRERQSTYPEFETTIEKLKMIDAKILGVVLNASSSIKKSRSYNYYHHYDPYR